MTTSSIVLRGNPEHKKMDTLKLGNGKLINGLDAIEVYLSTPGSVIPIRVLPSDTIQSMKLKIQRFKGFYVRQQMLICSGRELSRPDTMMSEYGITDGNVLHLVLRVSDLQVVRIKNSCGKKYIFRVSKNDKVEDLKKKISDRESGLSLDDQQLVLNGEFLDDGSLVDDLLLEDDAFIHLLIKKSAKVRAMLDGSDMNFKAIAPPVENINALKGANAGSYFLPSLCVLEPISCGFFEDLIKSVRGGIESGKSPKRSSEGCGGVYFMPDETGAKFVAVFKPTDEEPMAENNPRGLPMSENGEGLKRGTIVGGGAYREVAAYILDHPVSGPRAAASDEPGFAGVPPTVMVRCFHPEFFRAEKDSSPEMKLGSLQKYVDFESSCEDFGPASFPVHEVHKIAVLDIRLANADRHGGNILVQMERDSSIRLVPIDHGYCLPEEFEDCTFEWLYWPQAQKPFDSATVDYIKSLDAERDIQLLESHGWVLSSACCRVLRVSTMLLKKGSEAGLSPYEIATMMCRECLNKPSMIEKMVKEAEEVDNADFLDAISRIMDSNIAKRNDELIIA